MFLDTMMQIYCASLQRKLFAVAADHCRDKPRYTSTYVYVMQHVQSFKWADLSLSLSLCII